MDTSQSAQNNIAMKNPDTASTDDELHKIYQDITKLVAGQLKIIRGANKITEWQRTCRSWAKGASLLELMKSLSSVIVNAMPKKSGKYGTNEQIS
jgi:hypothetical protein